MDQTEQADPSNPAPSGPSFATLFLIFLKAGNLTFGGGDPTIAVLQRELCERRQWLSPQQYSLAYSLARITPGTNILAFCVAIAQMLGGTSAALASVIAASAPSALLAVWLTIFYESAGSNAIAKAAVSGVLAAVVGMMFAAAIALLRPHLTRHNWPRAVIFCGGTLALRQFLDLGPVQILVLAVLLALFWKEAE